MDRGAWGATVHEVAESDTTEHTHTQAYNVLYTRYMHVIGLRECLRVCLFVSLSLSWAPLIPSLAQVYAVSARTRTLLSYQEGNPVTELCVHAHTLSQML